MDDTASPTHIYLSFMSFFLSWHSVKIGSILSCILTDNFITIMCNWSHNLIYPHSIIVTFYGYVYIHIDSVGAVWQSLSIYLGHSTHFDGYAQQPSSKFNLEINNMTRIMKYYFTPLWGHLCETHFLHELGLITKHQFLFWFSFIINRPVWCSWTAELCNCMHTICRSIFESDIYII